MNINQTKNWYTIFDKIEASFQLIEIIIANLSVPVAAVADISNMKTMKTQHDDICEKIKTIRENYFEFCEDDTQFNTDMVSIEKDPEPYSDGTIKTKLILKKYACALLDKNEVVLWDIIILQLKLNHKVV